MGRVYPWAMSHQGIVSLTPSFSQIGTLFTITSIVDSVASAEAVTIAAVVDSHFGGAAHDGTVIHVYHTLCFVLRTAFSVTLSLCHTCSFTMQLRSGLNCHNC